MTNKRAGDFHYEISCKSKEDFTRAIEIARENERERIGEELLKLVEGERINEGFLGKEPSDHLDKNALIDRIHNIALTTLQATHEREKRELVREILEEQTTYDNYNNTACYKAVSIDDIEAIATLHNIDLSDPTEGSK